MQIPPVLKTPVAGLDTCSQYTVYTITTLRSILLLFFKKKKNKKLLSSKEILTILQKSSWWKGIFIKKNEIRKALNTRNGTSAILLKSLFWSSAATGITAL